MSIVSNLAQTKINAGGIAPFAASLQILNPQLSGCSQRGLFDQYGRPAPIDSIDTQTCPGLYSAENRIEVENSLRPYLSAKYFNLPEGISGAYKGSRNVDIGNYGGVEGGNKMAQGLSNVSTFQ